MPNPARFEDLVKRLESDPALNAQIEAAPSEVEKRAILDNNGFADLTVEDAKAYAAQVAPELGEEELAQIAGGGDTTAWTVTTVTVSTVAAAG